jgi:hypothetical protein
MSEHLTGQQLVNATNNLATGPIATRVYSDGGADRATAANAMYSNTTPTGVAYDPRTMSPLAPHEVNGSSIIRIRGAEVTIDQAKHLGWIKDGQSGSFAEAAQAHQPVQASQQQQQQPAQKEPQQQQPEPQAPQSAHGESIGKAGEEALGFLFNNTAPTDHLRAIEQLSETGEINEQTMGTLASQLGGHPSQISAMVEKVRPAFESQANRAVETIAGIDAEELFDWARTNRLKQLQGAVNSHLVNRTTEAYKQLARDYIGSLDTTNPDAILNAEVIGGSVGRDSQGRIYLTLSNGRTVSWSEAHKLGLMTLSRKR